MWGTVCRDDGMGQEDQHQATTKEARILRHPMAARLKERLKVERLKAKVGRAGMGIQPEKETGPAKAEERVDQARAIREVSIRSRQFWERFANQRETCSQVMRTGSG